MNKGFLDKCQRVIRSLSNQISSFSVGAHQRSLLYGEVIFMLH